MKTSKNLKGGDIDSEAERVLRDLLSRVSFINVKSSKRLGAPNQADLLFEVEAGGRCWVLVIETKRHGQPREVRNGVLQLQHYLKEFERKRSYGVLVAPFLSAESTRQCREAGIGYVDLAGNAHLSFDQVYIERESADNPFREKREARSLFAPRATRVLRILLQGPLRAWKVTELAKSADVSLGWVSAVRQQLLSHEWAEDQSGGLRVTKPHVVLDAWANADDWSKRTRTHEYSVLAGEDLSVLAAKLHSLLHDEHSPVFTQWFAASLRHPYTTSRVVTAYVTQLPEESRIERALLGRRVESGGRLRLVLPKDEGVFHPSQTVAGFNLVSDVQIYLDLVHAGERGDEQAAELRKWPDFAGGWS